MVDHFTKIPDEILLELSKYLSYKDLGHLAAVSKRTRRIAYDKSLYNSIKFAHNIIRSDSISYIFRRGFKGVKINFGHFRLPLYKRTAQFMLNYTNWTLRHLDLSNCCIECDTVNTLTSILKPLHGLKTLKLEGLPLDYSVCNCISSNRHLKKLNLSSTTILDKNCLFSIFANCKKIEVLNISWVEILDIDFFNFFAKNINSNLKELNISGSEHLTDEDLCKILKEISNLRKLDVSDCLKLSDKSVEAVLNHNNIIELSAHRCYKFIKEYSMKAQEQINKITFNSLKISVIGRN